MPAVQSPAPTLTRIISGGQSGADRAGLDWAIEHGVPHGGCCPKGRLAEDGPIPDRYQMTEIRSKSYSARTRLNVATADGTIIFTMGPTLEGGSKLTVDAAEHFQIPFLHVWASAPRQLTIAAVQSFISAHRIKVLNVAGSRASKEPAVGEFVRDVLSRALNPSSAEG